MIVSAVAAIDRYGVIGNRGKLPWSIKADMRRFQRLTMGKPVIMGRKTFESLGGPLVGRTNIVVSRSRRHPEDGFRYVDSVEDALDVANSHLTFQGNNEAMIIGGGTIYDATAAKWDRLYLSRVIGRYEGDTYFPVAKAAMIDWDLRYSEINADYSHRFLVLFRRGAISPPFESFDLNRFLAVDVPLDNYP